MLPHVKIFVKVIRNAHREGLRANDYHLEQITTLLTEARERKKNAPSRKAGLLTDLDLLLTDAFLIYGSHLLAGRINPETIDPEWRANRREANLAEILQEALESGQIEGALAGLLPPQKEYGKLKGALKRYRDLAAEDAWQAIPGGPNMERGERGERVSHLRRRLEITGDYDKKATNEPDLFVDSLEIAVRGFQERHGLAVDGVVGPRTLAALNVSAESRVRQIELNLERWRWLPQDFGERHILVNIANFELEVVEEGREIMSMRVVVGRDYRRTPVFSDRMTHLVFNPYWHIPSELAVQDILPEVRKDPDYLTRKAINVFRVRGSEDSPVDPNTIDWSKISSFELPYRFRQNSVPENPLGRVKFMFPNKFNVYLHDTPSRELFEKTVRTFSSGCIRIENPIELVLYLFRDDPAWSRERILGEIEKGIEQTVRLAETIPVHILYWTAWVDRSGTMQFRNDIYGRDRILEEALWKAPPRPF